MSEYNAVDSKGRPVKLTSYMQNKIYREAKELKGRIKDSQCTRSECWKPIDKNVQKMARNELSGSGAKDRDRYNRLMGNIGADPKDKDTERLRRY